MTKRSLSDRQKGMICIILSAFCFAWMNAFVRLSGDLPVMHRMWELWTYLAAGFDGAEPYLKRMRKAKNLSEYQAAVDALLREQPLVYSKEG